MNIKKSLIMLASLVFCIGMVTIPAFAAITDCTGQPDGTPCDDGDPTTVSDQCIVGVCTGTPATVFTTNNNFTMQNVVGDTAAFGGTNDVTFVWDGTMKTSVVASGQISNANIFSATPCLFFGATWSAHDVAVYGPGTYTVYTGCPAGSPGCGTGASYTFTVMPGQLGVHLLFDYLTSLNIDVIDVWDAAQPYGPYSHMFDGSVSGGCSSNPAGQVWDWMSSAWFGAKTSNKSDPNYGNVVNGAPLADGPFPGDFINFNVMVTPGVFCTHTPGACTDNNVCTIDYDATLMDPSAECPCLATPVPIAGCCNAAADCNDNNTCTTDACNTTTHLCTHTAFAGCCNVNTDCNDSNICTADTCNTTTHACVSTPIANCCLTVADCNDNDICTTNTCSTATHRCAYAAVVPPACNDNNVCTMDTCVSNACAHTPIANCCNTAADCDDNNACTGDTCVNHACIHTIIAIGCVTGADCNDGNVCTADTCVNQCECVYTAIPGCCNTAADCNDNNICTTDTCNLTTHTCAHTPIANCCNTAADCDDNNCVTLDTCVNNICIHAPIANECVSNLDCNDGNICTLDKCVIGPNGCGTCSNTQTVPPQCNDNNICTVDSCVNNACLHTPITNCCNVVADCNDNNACTMDTCVSNACVHTTIANCCTADADCNDNDVCTIDRCFNNMCVHANTRSCVSDAECNDANVCTIDTCVGPCGQCLSTPIPGCCTSDAMCNDNNACTVDTCNLTTHTCSNVAIAGCCITDAQCNDNNVCTTDYCNPTTHTCSNVPIAGCYCNTAAGCDDLNVCTTDTCVNNACIHTPTPGCCQFNTDCIISDPCQLCVCTSNACVCTKIPGCCITNTDCNDNNACTTDTCNTTTHMCMYAAIVGCCNTDADCNAGGIITTVAGNGSAGYSGDNGAATSAGLNFPFDIAIDSSGSIYVADLSNHRVRMIDTAGIITTVAGNGIFGYSGDNGPATSARLTIPTAIAVGLSGNIYIADTSNQRIRKVDTDGIITTVAGNGTSGFSGDNGPATSASLATPFGVAVDSSENIYIADQGNYRIRKVDTSGIITTVAGNGTAGYSGDNGPAASASLYGPSGVAVDSSGNIYIADTYNQRIRKVDTGGTITTVAGNVYSGYAGDNGPATSASLANPFDIAVDISGNIYIADTSNQRIRRVDTNGTITTVAGNGTVGYSGDNGPATSASLDQPYGVGVDSSGNIYIADVYNNRIRKVTAPDNNICTTDTCVSNQCQHTPIPGCCNTAADCNDNNVCTTDTCNPTAHTCSNVPIASCCTTDAQCNDNNVCTTDACTANACTHTNNTLSCDDGLFCNGADTCSGGVCVHAGNPCGAGTTCNESTDHCDAVDCTVQPAGTACTDNNACTTNDKCVKSGKTMVCQGTVVANGTACTDDGNLCTVDACQSGVCTHMAKCSDNNVCTTDICDPATGVCSYQAKVCNDNNPCTTDSCDPVKGCVYTQKPVGAACDDGNLCTTGDTCQGDGTCKGSPKNCNDGNNCTTDSCDPTTGACMHELGLQSVIILGSFESGENTAANKQIQTQFTIDQVASPGACITSYDISTVHVSSGATVNFDCHYGTGPDPTSGMLDGVPLTQDSGRVIFPTGDTTVHTLYLTNKAASGGNDVDNIKVQGF